MSIYSRRKKSSFKNRPSSGPSSRSAEYQSLEPRQMLAVNVLAVSGDSLWQQQSQDIATVSVGRNLIHAENFSLFDLQEAEFFKSISNAPLEFTPGFEANAAVLSVPTPDGRFEKFAIVEAPIMHPDLAAQFPNIKTYRGQGIDQPAATIRLDYTQHGFHAQVLSPDGQYYVDPYFHLQTDLYMSYYTHDFIASIDNANYSEAVYNDQGEFLYGHLRHNLGQDHDHEDEHDNSASDFPAKVSVGEIPDDNVPPAGSNYAPDFGTQLRTYQTAVAATGEYTGFWGGTVNAGQAAIVTAINRVTGVYEIEVAVRMELVPNNSSLVYTNGNTDPYSNNNGVAMLQQNQNNVDAVIGNANYDVGHVFSTGGGGVALLGVIGQTGAKAQGVTGLPSPTGDPFYIDYVAHELGHQFGANHTFNGDSNACAGGNRNGSTAYEPGSGSTIMGYAGICGNDDLQNHSDAMFHSISIDEIRVEVTTGTGNSSATITNTGNTIPVVSAGGNYIIPDQTPFELTATGSDADGNESLTYSWEQRDLGPQRDLNAPDNGSSPIFRAWLPTSDPTRVFPRMSNILNGTTPIGEQYPTTNWNVMDFRVVLRDNASGGGGVVSDDMTVRVVNSGTGFDVTSQSTSTSWTGLDNQTITWNVSGTDGGTINTPFVDIFFSLDGFNYDIQIADGVPNDGSHVIEVPNVDTTTGRIKVRGHDNVFFDVNRANITVTSSDPPDGGCGETFDVTPLNRGVAAADNATGTGYLMYSVEDVHTRLAQINVNSADHILAVRLNGSQWQYTNIDSVGWLDFTPAAGDVLLADVDYSADTATSLEGTSSVIGGIDAGYTSGDLVFMADMWNGGFNNGEFGVTGTFFTIGSSGGGSTIDVTPLNRGVAAADNATGTGYLMYSVEDVHTRLAQINVNSADHILAVRLNGSQWQYTNIDSAGWLDFTPAAGDVLLADVNYSADTVISLEGTTSTIGGIAAGYTSGDLVFTADMWNGGFNNGEFGVTGTFFTIGSSGGGSTIDVTPLNRGVAAADNATGTGYLMYSVEDVHTRLAQINVNSADHILAVRLNGSQWQYTNIDSAGWLDFTPAAGDVLLADVNYSADTVTSLEGTSSTIGGIAAGYTSGDLVFTADMWNGGFNNGEFGVTGTFFETNCPAGRPGGGGASTGGDGGDSKIISGDNQPFYEYRVAPFTSPNRFADVGSSFARNAKADLNFTNRPSLQFGEGPRIGVLEGSQLADLASSLQEELDVEFGVSLKPIANQIENVQELDAVIESI